MSWNEALSQLKELHIEKTSDSVAVKFKLHPRTQGRNKLKIKSGEIYGYLIAEGHKIEKGADAVFRNNDGIPQEHCLEFPKAKKVPPTQKKTLSHKKYVPKVSSKEG